ncbi:MAG TPA: hypothetical protein VKA34_17505 [Balneolales bacterium]|nr:hypothetical protein [Balneolales bacterium]
MTFLYPLPILVGDAFFVHSPTGYYLNALSFVITSLPIAMILGNLMSIHSIILTTTEKFHPIQFLLPFIISIPYVIFYLWLNSFALCLAFLGISVIVWYVYELPFIENKFLANLLVS